jgi:hypothetical protein
MPEELSAPITLQAAIPNGGKDAGSTIPSEHGLARKDRRQLETVQTQGHEPWNNHGITMEYLGRSLCGGSRPLGPYGVRIP